MTLNGGGKGKGEVEAPQCSKGWDGEEFKDEIRVYTYTRIEWIDREESITRMADKISPRQHNTHRITFYNIRATYILYNIAVYYSYIIMPCLCFVCSRVCVYLEKHNYMLDCEQASGWLRTVRLSFITHFLKPTWKFYSKGIIWRFYVDYVFAYRIIRTHSPRVHSRAENWFLALISVSCVSVNIWAGTQDRETNSSRIADRRDAFQYFLSFFWSMRQ